LIRALGVGGCLKIWTKAIWWFRHILR
jgi:hypothetical protein